MSETQPVVGNMFVKIGFLILLGVIAAIVVAMTVTPGPGSISVASAAWGLAVWLAVLTVAFVALVWQMAVHRHD